MNNLDTVNFLNIYDVNIGNGICKFLTNKKDNWFYVSDKCLSISNTDISLDINENNKTLDTINYLYDKFLDYNLNRKNSVVFAIGGGCLLDIVGYACATFMRGIQVVYIPTTLLAMVDACVGGKCGVNYHNLKNYIGTFYNPKQVVIDTSWLDTLPIRQFNNGMAEVIKYGCIYDKQLIIELLKDDYSLPYIIKRSIEIKAFFVADDITDKGKRQALNFGHTYAHAIESHTNYDILHGEAVSIGMNLVFDDDLLKEVCQKFSLPYCYSDIDELNQYMLKDKKNNGAIHFIKLKKLGEVDESTLY